MKKLLLSCFTATMLLTGCGESVDENKPISEVAAEAETMGKEKLQGMIEAYKKAIADKQPEIDAIKAKIKEIPLTEMLGDDMKGLKADMSQLTDSLKSLQERLTVYMDKLKTAK